MKKVFHVHPPVIHSSIHSFIHSSIPLQWAGGYWFTFRLIFCSASSLTHLLTDIKLAHQACLGFLMYLHHCNTLICVSFCHVWPFIMCWPLMSFVNTYIIVAAYAASVNPQHPPTSHAQWMIVCGQETTFLLHSFPKANHYLLAMYEPSIHMYIFQSTQLVIIMLHALPTYLHTY